MDAVFEARFERTLERVERALVYDGVEAAVTMVRHCRRILDGPVQTIAVRRASRHASNNRRRNISCELIQKAVRVHVLGQQ